MDSHASEFSLVTTNLDCRVLLTSIVVRGFFHNSNSQNIPKNTMYSIRVAKKFSLFYLNIQFSIQRLNCLKWNPVITLLW